MASPAPAPAAIDYNWWDVRRDIRTNNIEGIKRLIWHRPELVESSLYFAVELGRVEMTILLLQHAHPGAYMHTVRTAVRFNHADLVRALIAHAPHTVDHGFWVAVGSGNLAMAKLFLATGLIAIDQLNQGLVRAAHDQQWAILRCLLDAGATEFTRAMRATSISAPIDDVQLLIEKGATDWPDHVYWRLTDDPDRVVHLLKCGIPRALLADGRFPIQAIIDEQDRRDAHIHEQLDQLGVYKVLADLIVQY